MSLSFSQSLNKRASEKLDTIQVHNVQGLVRTVFSTFPSEDFSQCEKRMLGQSFDIGTYSLEGEEYNGEETGHRLYLATEIVFKEQPAGLVLKLIQSSGYRIGFDYFGDRRQGGDQAYVWLKLANPVLISDPDGFWDRSVPERVQK